MQITRSSIDTARARPTGSPATSTSTPSPPPRRRPGVSANLVHFMPGARTHWHRHPLSQTVFVTEGVGLCQRRGGPVEVIRPGDRVLFEADEEHWHGAAPNRLMVHVAINEADDDHAVVHWLTPVTDDGVQRRPGDLLTPTPTTRTRSTSHARQRLRRPLRRPSRWPPPPSSAATSARTTS